MLFLDKFTDRAAGAYTVDRCQMIVMAIFHCLLRINILTERRIHIGSLQIMRCKCISCHHAVYITMLDQLRKSSPRIRIKAEGRSHDPENISAMLFFITQQFIELVIIFRKGRLSGAVLTKCKDVSLLFYRSEPICMYKNTILALFGSSNDHQITFL